MKLYRILFEQEQLKLLSPEQMKAPKSAFSHLAPDPEKTDYSPPTFALVDWQRGGEHGFGLFHVQNFKKWIEGGSYLPFEPWLCAYAGITKEHKSDCMGAVEVAYMVRSPQWKGAGTTMYALISDHYGAPITSDRGSSTSNSAKKAWAGIESDSNWKKVELDNYRRNYQDRDWFQFKGSWPNRTVYGSDKPMTPNDDSDDCRLPTADHDVNSILGSADAWMYQGSLDAARLFLNGDQALTEIAQENGLAKHELEDKISRMADKMFSKYYKGVSG